MESEFDRTTAVTRRADETSYDAVLDPGWVVGGGVNGGYLLSVLGSAVAATAGAHGHPDPFIVSAHYLSASRPGPATVTTDVLRNGGSLTTVAATLTQEQDGVDVPRLTA